MTRDDLAARIVRAMRAHGDPVDTGPGEIEIVYVEGMNKDGTPNANRPNSYDDLRTCIRHENGKPVLVKSWEATTQPGHHYGRDRLLAAARARGGAPIIAWRKQWAWVVGFHQHKPDHEALVSRDKKHPTKFHIDKDKNFDRTNDPVQEDAVGLNQHDGRDSAFDNADWHTAGCLVGRTRQGQKEFMAIVKSDPRYKANKNYVFATTVMPASWVLQDYPEPALPKPKPEQVGIWGAVAAFFLMVGAFVAEHPWWTAGFALALIVCLLVAVVVKEAKEM